MNLTQKIHQLFIAGFNGTDINNNNIFLELLEKGLGGVIFFTQNIQSREQIQTGIKQIKEQSLVQPFLSIDQEGGRVERTENIHNGKKYLSAKDAANKGLDFVKEQTNEICDELISYGINMNFAPVLDTNTNPLNPIIGIRAYGNTPYEVIKYTNEVIDIHRKKGVIPVGKHFPGHGDTYTDSHIEMPIVKLSEEEMQKTHLKPFVNAIKNGIEAIMISHVYYTCYDDAPTPASLSKKIITDLLRKNLQFKGLVISDDMVMGAVHKQNNTDTYIKALKSGINMFIYRYSDKNLCDIINQIENIARNDNELLNAIYRSNEYILELKKMYNL